jgi:carbon monoxide dehydrogenase subunit G
MKFENTFAVDAPIDEVYATLLDVERVAPCVPGAEVLEKTGDNAYQVAIKVRVGPISMTYRGNVEIVERDDENHRAVMRARARETRGQGTADARVELNLAQDGPTTNGTMVADVQLAGRAAAMGRGVIQDVSAKIVSTFSQNLETMLSGGGPAAEEPVTAVADTPASAPASAGASEPQATGPEAPPEPVTAAATGAEAGGGPEAAAATAPPPPGTVGAPTPPPPAAPPRPQTPAAPAEESSLPVGQIVGSVLLERLKDPKVLGAIGASAAVVFAVVRRRNR